MILCVVCTVVCSLSLLFRLKLFVALCLRSLCFIFFVPGSFFFAVSNAIECMRSFFFGAQVCNSSIALNEFERVIVGAFTPIDQRRDKNAKINGFIKFYILHTIHCACVYVPGNGLYLAKINQTYLVATSSNGQRHKGEITKAVSRTETETPNRFFRSQAITVWPSTIGSTKNPKTFLRIVQAISFFRWASEGVFASEAKFRHFVETESMKCQFGDSLLVMIMNFVCRPRHYGINVS